MSLLRATALGFAAAVTCLILPLAASAQQLDKPIELREKANASGAESQKRVEEISSETDTLIAQWRLTQKKIESLQIFNRQITEVIGSQTEELASLQEQIDGVEEIGRAVTPLMLKMIESLDSFVELDVPFLKEERARRVDQLRVLMRRSDVSEPERYRRILEAFQIENDYGRTIEAYPGTLMKNGAEITVDYLRVGRLALMYQTRDGSEVGVYNKNTKAFEPVKGYENWMSEALRVAKKQSAPQLIRVPLPRPEKGGAN